MSKGGAAWIPRVFIGEMAQWVKGPAAKPDDLHPGPTL